MLANHKPDTYRIYVYKYVFVNYISFTLVFIFTFIFVHAFCICRCLIKCVHSYIFNIDLVTFRSYNFISITLRHFAFVYSLSPFRFFILIHLDFDCFCQFLILIGTRIGPVQSHYWICIKIKGHSSRNTLSFKLPYYYMSQSSYSFWSHTASQ